MSVDFWHRLVVTGRGGAVELFRRQLRRTLRRSVAGHRLRRETIPFSFERLYQLVPAAVRLEPQVPDDPYDLSAWPTRRLPRGLAEVRYQLHTRNIELRPFVRLLSKEFASLMFCLVTFCLDDGEVASYQVCNRRVHKWILPRTRREVHWERARQKFGLSEDSVYDDDVATEFAEEAMLAEALEHWESASKESRHSRRRARSWSNRPASRDLFTEMSIALAKFNEQFPGSEAKTSRKSN